MQVRAPYTTCLEYNAQLLAVNDHNILRNHDILCG